MKLGRTVAVVTGLVLTGGLLATSVASAGVPGPHYWMYTDEGRIGGPDRGGKAEFWSRGDHVQVCDIDADGAVAHLAAYEHRGGRVVRSYHLRAAGDGNCTKRHASDHARYDLPETCIKFKVWLKKAGGGVYPSSVDTAYWDNDNHIKSNCNF